MEARHSRWPIEHNIAMELVRVTEAAAMAAARCLGMGDKNLVDEPPVTAIYFRLLAPLYLRNISAYCNPPQLVPNIPPSCLLQVLLF